MRLLLDTHAFLWLVEGNPALSAAAQAAIAKPESEVFLSVASIWELAIKTNNGKLSLNEPLADFMERWTTQYKILVLPVELAHALAVGNLPLHHRDPFDRMLIAQATSDRLAVVSRDAQFQNYKVPVIW